MSTYTGTDNLEVMQEAVNYNRYLLDLILKYAGDVRRVIDFGAGSGTFAEPIAASGFEVTAVELDDGLRRDLTGKGLRAVASAAELGIGSFAYAYTFNVLEHIADDVDALRQLRKTLAPGARLLVYVPAFQVLYTSMDAKVGHVRRYSRHLLTRNVRDAGFTVDSVEYVDSLGYLATLAFRFVDRGGGGINRTALKIYDRVLFPVSRALDRLTHRWFGKNLVLVARNPGPPLSAPSQTPARCPRSPSP